MKNNCDILSKIKEMKKLCMNKIYNCNGELLRILDSKQIIPLISKLKFDEKILLSNKLVFGKDIVLSQELFLKNLDYYIGYIRDTYMIQHTELPFIIIQSLSNKYADILLSKDDFHNNYNKYCNSFIRMFLYNVYNNIINYKYCDNKVKNFRNQISKYDFNSDIDIYVLENEFKKVLNSTKGFLCQIFMDGELFDEKNKENMYLQLELLFDY